MKDRKFAKFYKKYLIVLIIILFFGLSAVWSGLVYVQRSHESEYSEEDWIKTQSVFETYVSELTIEDWAKLWEEKNPDSFDSHDTVLSVLGDKFSRNVNYARAKTYSDDSPVYVIENDEQTLVEISVLQASDSDWHIGEVSFRFKGDKSASVVVPTGCTVVCNGKALDSTYISSSDDYFFMQEYSGNLINAVKLETWTVSGQLIEPDLSVMPPEGLELAENSEGQPVLIQRIKDEELCRKADTFFDAYNKYGLYGYYDISNNMRAAASLCKKDSQAYTLINESLQAISLAPCHSVYTTNKDMGPVAVWADNAVSIDITYDTETTYAGNEKDYFSGAYRILMIDFGNGFEICGFVNA